MKRKKYYQGLYIHTTEAAHRLRPPEAIHPKPVYKREQALDRPKNAGAEAQTEHLGREKQRKQLIPYHYF